MIVWLTGISSAGKTTIANGVHSELALQGKRSELLDGDEIRNALGNTLGYSREDRNENIRRIGHIALLLEKHDVIPIVAAISPYQEARDIVRYSAEKFVEVYVDAPLEVCEARDVKGLYEKARRGEIRNFTGIDDPYEIPQSPEVVCMTAVETVDECVSKVLSAIASGLENRRASA